MNGQQRRMNAIAAMYGYPVQEDTVPAAEFSPGDGVIVLTDKGEPIMSGKVTDVRHDETMGRGAIRVGEDWYCESDHRFRHL